MARLYSKGRKFRIEVEPVETLGDLIDLVGQAQGLVDQILVDQTQRDTPIKLEFSLGMKIKAITLLSTAP